jgi:hypothetical protein
MSITYYGARCKIIVFIRLLLPLIMIENILSIFRAQIPTVSIYVIISNLWTLLVSRLRSVGSK